MQRVIVYDRYDAPLFEVSGSDLSELVRQEVINGAHSLTITTTQVLQSGMRVLTLDDRNIWREFVVYGVDELHETGLRPVGTYYCVWSIQPDLMGSRISKMPGTKTPVTAGVALEAVLSGTKRWSVGTVTNANVGGASMYDTDAWSAMSTMLETWGGEIDVSIEVGPTGIVSRKVDYYSKQGNQTATRRYDFGADLRSVRRKFPDGPLYCRITPRGKGEETDSGSYGRKVTIADVNDGKDYLENSAMVDLAKLPDGSGGWEYPTLVVENSDCETPAELLAWGRTVVEEYTVPKITYEVDVLQLSAEGVDMHGVSLGDAVHVVDRKFGEGLRVQGRATSMTVNMLDEKDVQLTIGYIEQGIAGMLGGLSGSISTLRQTVLTMNGGTLSTADYLSNLLSRLNAEINATGGYTYITQGQGLRTYDKAVSDPLVGDEADSVVELKGGTIRIANTKDAQGDWEWLTVFTSGHIAVDLVTAAHLTAGYIGNAGGSYWDLDNDSFQIANTAQVGTRTVADLLQTVDSTITAVENDVEYAQNQSNTEAPTDGWQTTAPTWRDGYFIWQRTKNSVTTAQGTTTTYSEATCISGREGTDGIGISEVAVGYGVSASESEQPSSWHQSVPALEKGQWLWVRNVTTYDDATTLTTYSKSYIGTDGEDGTSVVVQSSSKVDGVTTIVITDGTTTSTITIEDGTDGTNGTDGINGLNGYVHVAWANSANGATDFSTSVSTNKKYIGVYTDNTLADSTRYQDYSWSLIKGADGTDGKDGKDGVGIASIVEQYYLSTSSSTPTGSSSGWSSTQPAWLSGKYIWTRSLITWDNGDTSTTTPVLAGALNSANQKAEEAAKVATNYLTFNSSNGLDVGYSGTSAKTRINGSGMEVFDGNGDSGAFFGIDGNSNPYARIGTEDEDKGNVKIQAGSTSDSMNINLCRGSSVLAAISYGLVHRYGVSSIWRGPYNTFGTRASDGSYYPGWASFVLGQECVARGPQSFAGGASCKALSPLAFTYGSNNTVDTGSNSSDIGAAFGKGLLVYGPLLACGTYNAYNSTINQFGRLIVGGGTSSGRSNAMVVYNDGDTVIAGSLTQSSDRRLKDHIAYLHEDAVEFIRSLKPALFSMKSNGVRRLGFYAQDIQDAEPEEWDTDIVREEGMSEDMPNALALDYTALIAPLVAYTQLLEKRIEQLEQRITELEGA